MVKFAAIAAPPCLAALAGCGSSLMPTPVGLDRQGGGPLRVDRSRLPRRRRAGLRRHEPHRERRSGPGGLFREGPRGPPAARDARRALRGRRPAVGTPGRPVARRRARRRAAARAGEGRRLRAGLVLRRRAPGRRLRRHGGFRGPRPVRRGDRPGDGAERLAGAVRVRARLQHQRRRERGRLGLDVPLPRARRRVRPVRMAVPRQHLGVPGRQGRGNGLGADVPPLPAVRRRQDPGEPRACPGAQRRRADRRRGDPRAPAHAGDGARGPGPRVAPPRPAGAGRARHGPRRVPRRRRRRRHQGAGAHHDLREQPRQGARLLGVDDRGSPGSASPCRR